MATETVSKPAKRPYLAKDARRQLFLDTAAELVESQGWDKLNMSSLAQQANTSRQLLYQHFESLEDLMVATGTHIFEQVYVQTRATINAGDLDIVAVLEEAQRLTLELPPGRANALWQLLAATFPPEHELSRFGRRMRHLVTKLWQPAVARAFRLSDEDAAATTWMIIMAFWGGYRLMADGEISQQQAIARLNWMVTALTAGVQRTS